MHAIAVHKSGTKTNMKSILFLYFLGTFLAGTVAVVASFMFPVTLTLTTGAEELVLQKVLLKWLKHYYLT